MCGHFGIIGPGIQAGDLSILEDLSFISSVRGTDAMGIAYGHSGQNKAKVFKMAGDPFYFNYMSKNAKDLDSVFNNFFIGHTRSSTRGVNGNRGAHPYEYGDIIGAHNGTIRSYHNLGDFPTDSAKLFESISRIGFEATIANLEEDDAMALVWYDKKTRKVNFYRNGLRPLVFCIDHKRRVMYWFSETGGLRWMMDRYGIDHSGLYHFTEGYVYSFDPSKIGGKEIKDCFETRPAPFPAKKKDTKVVHIGGKKNQQATQQQQLALNKPTTTNNNTNDENEGGGHDIGWLSPEAREALSK